MKVSPRESLASRSHSARNSLRRPTLATWSHYHWTKFKSTRYFHQESMTTRRERPEESIGEREDQREGEATEQEKGVMMRVSTKETIIGMTREKTASIEGGAGDQEEVGSVIVKRLRRDMNKSSLR